MGARKEVSGRESAVVIEQRGKWSLSKRLEPTVQPLLSLHAGRIRDLHVDVMTSTALDMFCFEVNGLSANVRSPLWVSFVATMALFFFPISLYLARLAVVYHSPNSTIGTISRLSHFPYIVPVFNI